MYYQQKINGTSIGVYLPINFSKLHSILAVANLFANNNLCLSYYVHTSQFATAEIECSFEMGV